MLKKYLQYHHPARLQGDNVYRVLNEESILEAETILREEGQELSNLYFKVLANICYLEKESAQNREEIAYLYYLLVYYLGLFFHPTNGEEIAFHYLDKASELRSKAEVQEKIETVKSMIKREEFSQEHTR